MVLKGLVRCGGMGSDAVGHSIVGFDVVRNGPKGRYGIGPGKAVRGRDRCASVGLGLMGWASLRLGPVGFGSHVLWFDVVRLGMT